MIKDAFQFFPCFFFSFPPMRTNKRFSQKWNFIKLHKPVRVHSCLATRIWHLLLQTRRKLTMYITSFTHYVCIHIHTYIFFIYLSVVDCWWQTIPCMDRPADCLSIATLTFLHHHQTRWGGKYLGVNIHFTWKMEFIDHDPATYLQSHFCCSPLIRLEAHEAMWACFKSQWATQKGHIQF